MLILSCHADTNFSYHALKRTPEGYEGFLDNFAGVYAVMRAYFSGKLFSEKVRIVLTEEEETTMAGALRVREGLDPNDLVVVVDVTGLVGDWDFTIEKCADPASRRFVRQALKGFRYRLYENSPDPIADTDEVDVYREKCAHTFFLGVPCAGGDYNREPVKCTERSIQAVADAISALCKAYEKVPASF